MGRILFIDDDAVEQPIADNLPTQADEPEVGPSGGRILVVDEPKEVAEKAAPTFAEMVESTRSELDGLSEDEKSARLREELFGDGVRPLASKAANMLTGGEEEPQNLIESAARTAGDAVQATLAGPTLGFSDEIQSVIAATVASPFVSDKTFSQLMVDARKSIREDAKDFSEDSPATSTALNIAGGLPVAVPAVLAGSPVAAGAVMGGVAGGGGANAAEFLSLDTALSSAVGAGGGALLGATLPKAAEFVSKSLQRIVGNNGLRVFDESGQFTDDAMRELSKMVDDGRASPEEINALVQKGLADSRVLTPEQAQRFNLFARTGVTPTRANITQSVDDFRMQGDALKRSGPVADRVANQDAQITSAVEEGIEGIRPVAQNLPEANSAVFSVVDDVVARTDEAVGAAYAAAREAAQGQPRVGLDGLAKAISDNRGSERISGGVMSAVRGVLKNNGVILKGGNLDINKHAARLTGEGTRKLTVEQAEAVRQQMNALHDSATPQGKRIIRSLKDALDDDVEKAVGADIFEGARASKTSFQRMIERQARNKFDKTKGGFLEDVIDNKIPEEKIIPRLLSGRDDDLIKFRDFLLEDAGEGGQQAWNDIRAQTLRDALEKATGTAGKNAQGERVFNSRLFNASFQKLRKSRKFEAMFNSAERQMIDDIAEVGRFRVPPSAVAQGSGPSGSAVDSLKKEIARRIPLVGERAVELFDMVATRRADAKLLDVAGPTSRALRQ